MKHVYALKLHSSKEHNNHNHFVWLRLMLDVSTAFISYICSCRAQNVSMERNTASHVRNNLETLTNDGLAVPVDVSGEYICD